MIEKAETKPEDAENYRKVVQAVKEYIFQTHKFPSKTQIADLARASASTGIETLLAIILTLSNISPKLTRPMSGCPMIEAEMA
jgi:hypothetical protein